MCSECDDPLCNGQGQLRKFRDWPDLSSHLSEEDILCYINHLHAIGPNYERLLDEERKDVREAKKALMTFNVYGGRK